MVLVAQVDNLINKININIYINMKKSYIYLIGLFFIFYILFNFYKEGYINIYGPEEFFKPDYSFLHKYRCNNNNEITDPRLIFQREIRLFIRILVYPH